MFAAATIPATLAIVWIFAHYMELTTYLQNLVFLIGFGIAIDYSLLVVYRYREEHRDGVSKDDAVVKTMATAGRAVVFSGTAVGIGLALMLFMPLPFMRGFGIGGLAIPLVSIVAAITLLPVLLHLCAGPLDRVRLLPKRITERREAEENFWVKLARSIMRRPGLVRDRDDRAPPRARRAGARARARAGLEHGDPAEPGVGAGASTCSATRSARARSRRPRSRSTPARSSASAIPRCRTRPGSWSRCSRSTPRWRASTSSRPSSTSSRPGRFIRMDVVGKHEYGDPVSADFVHRLRDEIIPKAGFPASAAVFAGGGPPGGVDFLDVAYSAFPWLVLGVLLLTYLLLLRAFRSLLLPLKAIVLNLLSILAAYGLLTAFFKWGPAEAVGLIGFDQIEGWIPIFVFAMVFGLSMDYEVFLVSRMREEWDKTKDNEYAVSMGLAKTGRIVTAAGPHHVRRVHGLRRRLGRRAPAVRLRARDRDPHRRDDRARAPRAERDGAVRPLELVASRRRGAVLPRRAVAARGASPRLLRRRRDDRLVSVQIEVVEGDITALDVDAIANAANDRLWMGAGVAGAIKRAGGDEIERQAVALGPIALGDAVATGRGPACRRST